MGELMRVRVVGPERVVFDGLAEFVLCPGKEGDLGILPRHIPYVSMLQSGEIMIKSPREEHRISTGGGLLRATPEKVLVYLDGEGGEEGNGAAE